MFDVGDETSQTATGSSPIRSRRGNGGRGIQCDYDFADGTTGHIYYTPKFDCVESSQFCSSHASAIPPRINHFSAYDDDGFYTASFNSWINRQLITIDATSYQRQLAGQEAQRWKFIKKLKFPYGAINCVAFGSSLKLARERAFFILQNHLVGSQVRTEVDALNYFTTSWKEVSSIYEQISLNRLECQMESPPTKESMQGEATQESEKVNNTIITRDEAKTTSHPLEVVSLNRFSSSEPTAQFNQAVNRWIPLKPIKTDTNMKINEIVKAYYLPESLYEEAVDTINLMPFENYIYSDLTIAVKFMVNANKFQCGKLICSVKFDSSYAEETFTSVQSALCRPHVILDLASNNEGELVIPFRYHRTFVRNVRAPSNNAVRPSKYATVLVQVLSQLRTGSDNPSFVTLRPFVTLSRAEFAATSYRVSTQMDGILNVVDSLAPNPALHTILSGVERLLTNPGRGRNRDKPTDLNNQIVVPHPSRSFGHGKGPMNVIPLRMDPTTMTSVQYVRPYEDDPLTTLQIAQIWGLRASFQWQAAHSENQEIFSLTLDPSKRELEQSNSPFTPLEQMCSLYQFWTGTYELRFDFVSNAFHTGTLLFSIEFSRPADSSDSEMAKVSSNYTKTFQLGDQKSVTLRVPYIYDTLWRRCNTPPFVPQLLENESEYNNLCLGVEHFNATRLSCRVVNKLLPTQTVSQAIDILVFMRGSENFRLHSLKQAGLYSIQSKEDKKQFPYDYAPKTTPSSGYNRYGEILRSNIPTYPVTQMDTGEKEDLDPTDQFNLGLDGGQTQTNDSQNIIKDIVRRPTMIFYLAKLREQSATATDLANSAFFIPIMPPTPQLYAPNIKGMLNTIVNTPQSRLLNMFKFYRGSCRYTILIHDTAAEPVFVTHIPHSGIEVIGNIFMCDKEQGPEVDPIFASGLHTEVIVPSINPMMTFEAPFDTENNWVCCKVDQRNLNYPWRDKADTNAGHIAISSSKARTFSVWWSAGDDFELCNFYGVENLTSRYDIIPTDNLPIVETQSDVDFRGDEISDCRPSFSKHNTEVFDVKFPKNLIEEMHFTTAEARNLVADVRGTLVPKAEQVFDTLKTIITPLIPSEAANTKFKIIKEVLWSLATALVTQNWVAVGMSIFRSICELLDISDFEIAIKYASKLGQAMKNLTSPKTQSEPATPRSTIVGILVGFVGQIFKVTLDRKKYDNLFDNISDKVTSAGTWGYLNQCLTYIQRIYGTLADLATEAIGKLDPEVQALKMLCENNQAVSKFAADVQQMTSPVNYQMFKDPTFRLKYWRTYMQALQIQRLLLTVPTSYAKPGLAKMCSEMKRHADENAGNLMSHPCRPEPIVIQITGGAGIGKSHISKHILKNLSKHVPEELYRGGVAYLRNPASKFWNGYRGEFGVMYDDFCNLNNSEHLATQIGELFQLKTRQDFIPEMAAVDKKENFAAPLAVMLLSNQDFPTCIANIAFTPEAVYRRRDILIKAEIKPEFIDKDPREIPHAISDTYQHLTFRLHNKPKSEAAGYSDEILTWEQLMEYIDNKFSRHLELEKVEIRNRLHDMRNHIGGIGIGEIDIVDPFAIFYSLEVEEQSRSPSWVPSEALEKSVNELSAVLGTITRQPETQADETDRISEIAECSNCNNVTDIDQICSNNHKLCNHCVVELDHTLTCVVCKAESSHVKTRFSRWIQRFVGRWKEFIALIVRGGDNLVKKTISRIRAFIANCKVRTESDEEFNPLHLHFNPVQVMTLTKVQPSSLPQCYHHDVLKQVEDMSYFQGKEPAWRILVEAHGITNYLNVPLHACSEKCPFADYVTYATMIKRYIELNRNALFSNILAYYNCSSEDRNKLLERVPIFLRPTEENLKPKKWYEYLTGAFEKYKHFLTILLKIGVCCAAIVGLLGLVIGPKETIVSESTAYESGSLARLKQTIQVKRTHRERVIRAQSDMTNVVEAKIMNNYVIMRIWKNGMEKASLVLIGIYAHQAILPKHSLRAITRQMENGCEFTIEPALYSIDKKNHLRSKYTYSVADFRVINDTDVACMQMPSSYPLFKDIRKFFCTEVEASQHLPREAYLILAPTKSRSLIHVKDVDITGVQKAICSTDPEGESFVIDLAIAYDHSERGACGSLLLLENRNRPIYAMHVAGENDIGYGLQLTQEALSSILRPEVVTQLEDVDLIPIQDDVKCFLLSEKARVKYMGLVPKELKPHIPNCSDIRPSLIHKKAGFIPTKEPAILSPTDSRYKALQFEHPPLWYGCNKHGIQTTDFPSHVLKHVAGVLWETKFQDLKPVVAKPYRLNPVEAVIGIKDVPFYEPIKLNTSAGFPWQRLGKSTLKDCWIEAIRDEQQQMVGCNIHADLLAEIERKEQLRINGIQPMTIFTDTLKDETRKIAKVATAGGTRVFCASPVDYTIAQRQNLLHLCAAIMKARLKIHCAVGINAKGTEWTELVNYLAEVGLNNISTFDYSDFGPALNAQVAAHVVDLMVKWTLQNVSHVHEVELRTLLYECINSVHCAAGTVYQQFAGSPSGASITTVINSLVNIFYIYVAWDQLIAEPNKWDIFHRNIRFVVYGDDLIMSVSEVYKETFNATILAKFFGNYGIVATDASKQSEVIPYTSIFDASFLKRGFRMHPNGRNWLGPLEWSSINDTTQWIRKSSSDQSATLQNCEAALMESHAYGEEIFLQLREQINVALSQAKIRQKLTHTWQYIDKLWFQEGEWPSTFVSDWNPRRFDVDFLPEYKKNNKQPIRVA